MKSKQAQIAQLEREIAEEKAQLARYKFWKRVRYFRNNGCLWISLVMLVFVITYVIGR